jgi:uncharacterized protein YpbB
MITINNRLIQVIDKGNKGFNYKLCSWKGASTKQLNNHFYWLLQSIALQA